MKIKKTAILLITALLIALTAFPLNAFAAESGTSAISKIPYEYKTIGAYYTDNEFYAFVKGIGETAPDIDKLFADVSVDGEILENDVEAERSGVLISNGIKKHLFVLVSVSVGFDTLKADVTELIKTLYAGKAADTSITVLTSSSVVSAGETAQADAEKLISDETGTAEKSAEILLSETLDLINGTARDKAELYGICMVTSGTETALSDPGNIGLKRKLKSTPVFVHTYTFDTAENSDDTGAEHVTVSAENAESYADPVIGVKLRSGGDANEITNFADNVYYTIVTQSTENGIYADGEKHTLCVSVSELQVSGNFDITSTELTDTVIPKAESLAPPEISDDSSTESDVSEDESSEAETPPKIEWRWDITIIVAAVIIAVAAVLIFAKSKKKKNGISMAVKIKAGKKTKTIRVQLCDEITIGRSRKCDIRLNDKASSGVNSRIYRDADGFIFIEDLGSTNGTLIDGMKIHAKNRLRSGNTVTVGETNMEFRF